MIKYTKFLAVALSGALGLPIGADARADQAPMSGNDFVVRQPVLAGIADNFFVPMMEHRPTPRGRFILALWGWMPMQPELYKAAVTSWDGGEITGLHTDARLRRDAQAGFADRRGVTIVQINGEQVGAYINSHDAMPFSEHPNGSSMMIAPGYRFPGDAEARPFIGAARVLDVSLDLQVPTSSDAGTNGSESYVTFDIELADHLSGQLISLDVNLFFNGRDRGDRQFMFYDSPTKNHVLYAPLRPEISWVRVMGDSVGQQYVPWRGYKAFHYQITSAGFARALADLRQKYSSSGLSADVRDYRIVSFHLNAEVIFRAGFAELGWSMKRLQVAGRATDR